VNATRYLGQLYLTIAGSIGGARFRTILKLDAVIRPSHDPEPALIYLPTMAHCARHDVEEKARRTGGEHEERRNTSAGTQPIVFNQASCRVRGAKAVLQQTRRPDGRDGQHKPCVTQESGDQMTNKSRTSRPQSGGGGRPFFLSVHSFPRLTGTQS